MACTRDMTRTAATRTYIAQCASTPHKPTTSSLSSPLPQAPPTSSSMLSLSKPTFVSTKTQPTDYFRLNQIRAFSASGPIQDGGHHFDTHRFVEKLEREGFTRQQSEAIMNALDEVVSESMDNLTKNMVTKADQDKTVYTYKVDFAALKSELQMLEKNDFSLTNTNNERLVSEIEKLRQRLREEVARTQAGVRLDLNLEKGRIRDEAATQELKVRATEERIEQEIAALRTQMETIKLQTLQYMIGTITGAGALILAYLRMFK
ncbi:hypothetical protein BG006_009492 [Podila minutissima]|uniref:DUF1640-domain-containing protein n=1 Tax=Podila minutissima TaxID=64525 RepID=A0A9P5SIK6_9FUNG|nr:hypothetical protein BG006_009492 [Podila minutissima]